MGKIVVIGSANTDLVVKTDRMPSPGETILGGSFMMSGGGKGANQAVAASRLGGEVTFVARVGNDLFGERALAVGRGADLRRWGGREFDRRGPGRQRAFVAGGRRPGRG